MVGHSAPFQCEFMTGRADAVRVYRAEHSAVTGGRGNDDVEEVG